MTRREGGTKAASFLVLGLLILTQPRHPGEGRDPAGVSFRGDRGVHARSLSLILFMRFFGSSVWIPAFAGMTLGGIILQSPQKDHSSEGSFLQSSEFSTRVSILLFAFHA